VPLALAERRLGPVDRLSGVLEVHERVGWELQMKLGAAVEHVCG
jgi:hypothetical protein